MATSEQSRQFLVVVQLGNTSPERLQEVVPEVRLVLERLSSEPLEMAFRAVSADIFGFLVRATKVARQIEAALLRPSGIPRGGGFEPPSGLDNKDHVFVLELGPDCASSQGFSRALTWMQRH